MPKESFYTLMVHGCAEPQVLAERTPSSPLKRQVSWYTSKNQNMHVVYAGFEYRLRTCLFVKVGEFADFIKSGGVFTCGLFSEPYVPGTQLELNATSKVNDTFETEPQVVTKTRAGATTTTAAAFIDWLGLIPVELTDPFFTFPKNTLRILKAEKNESFVDLVL